jgi:hypothetical protein
VSATGVTAYLKNGGTLERAAQMGAFVDSRSTQSAAQFDGELHCSLLSPL